MADNSNVDEVEADLIEFVKGFNFTTVGHEGALGREIVKTVAAGIQARGVQDQRSAAVDWPENTDNPPGKGYASWKAKRYGFPKAIPNVRTNQMLSMPSLEGAQTTIEPDLITMRYGTGEVTDRSDSPNRYLGKEDTRKTDLEKANFAHTGQGPHGTLRPFYEFDDEIAREVIEVVVQKALEEYLERQH